MQGVSPEANPAAIASHFAAAETPAEYEKSIIFATRAGETANEQLAYEDAARHFEDALEALEKRAVQTAHERGHLLLAMADSHRRAGDLTSAREALTHVAKLARQYHPDVSQEPNAEARFKEVNEAYEVLSDQQKRAAYDRFGHAGTQSFSGFEGFGGFRDPFEIFEEFFGASFGMGARRARRGPRRGADLRYDMEIQFEEAVFGAEKEIEVPRQQSCPRCQPSN